MTEQRKIRIDYDLGGTSVPRIKIVPGIPHKIVVHRKRMTVDIIEAEDITFRYNSALMLPSVIPVSELPNELPGFQEALLDETLRRQRAVAGLSVIKGLFRYVDLCRARTGKKKLLITGHTDSVGSDRYNSKLSLERARVVLSVVLGDQESRDTFAAIVDERHAPEDQQHVLKWIAKLFGWPDVDPEEVDGIYGSKTVNAAMAFKRNLKSAWKFPPSRYQQVSLADDMAERIAALKDGSHLGEAAWKVIFEIYQAELRLALMEDAIDLDALRAGLEWVDDDRKAVGCGETWPLAARGVDNYKSETNRRVEILLYDPDELKKPLPCKEADCAEGDCHIFKNTDRYALEKGSREPKIEWRYIGIDQSGKLLGNLLLFTDIHVDEAIGNTFVFRSSSGYECIKKPDADRVGDVPWVTLYFENALQGDRYTLLQVTAEGAEEIVFENVPWRAFSNPPRDKEKKR